jgi:sugar fermentation stimulation protein
VELADGTAVEAHIADRGRLERLLVPGAEVHVARALPAGAGPPRRTQFTLLVAREGAAGPLCCVDPAGANRLVRALLDAADPVLPLPAHRAVRAEVRHGASRFDFELALRRGGKLLLEVKSVGVAEDGVALFPDAPSERAARHCRELAARVRRGGAAAILLVAQRGDVRSIRPHPVDPLFARELAAAHAAGVRVLGVAFEVTLDGFVYLGPRPVVLRSPRVPRPPAPAAPRAAAARPAATAFAGSRPRRAAPRARSGSR